MIKMIDLASSIANFSKINTEIKLSSLVKISGDNGSGKTSLIKILAGLSTYYTGQILINDYNLRCNIEEFKKNLQVVFAQNGLYEDLTVEENIKLFSRRWSGADLTNAGISVFGLEKYRFTKVKKLSSGFQRKVLLAKLIACPSNIWIIDEIDSYLDSSSLALLKDVVIQRVKNYGIVFYTAHSDYLSDINNQEILLNPQLN